MKPRNRHWKLSVHSNADGNEYCYSKYAKAGIIKGYKEG